MFFLWKKSNIYNGKFESKSTTITVLLWQYKFNYNATLLDKRQNIGLPRWVITGPYWVSGGVEKRGSSLGDKLLEIDDKQPYFRGYNGYNLSNVDNNSRRMGDNSSELGNNLFKMRRTVSNGLDGGGGGDNSNKRCFGRKPNCSGNPEISPGIGTLEQFFRETRDNFGTMQQKIGTSRKF